ncbi:unnamed protein product [Somion occarium]|uniref:Mitochondrial import inner membrane translocase subunit Tim21 n=1 Tax=Somion occarium TaxID=3059160 RepID=A0ABP1CNY2_9APHY
MHSFSSSTSRLIGRSTSCKNVYHVYTSSVHAQAFRIQLLLPFRTYATHRDAATASTTPLLSQALDQRQRSARRQDSVGPFQLGLIPPTPQDVGEIKKWSQLNTTEKVVRTTARTTNLVVILFGAGLSAVLFYALTSEMFSKNSPTVLYGQACDIIKASPRVTQFLQGPFTFHNNPPTGVRPRHRNHHTFSQIFVDQTGREHMRLHFFVQGREPGSVNEEDSNGYIGSVVAWTERTASDLSKMTFDEVVNGAKSRASEAVEACRGVFRFLSGEPVPSKEAPGAPIPESKEEPEPRGWMSSVTGMFSGLKGSSSPPTETQDLSHGPPTATEE